MASIINADNGAVSGITGVTTTADNSGNLALQANGVTLLTATTANTVSISGATSFTNNVSISGATSFANSASFTGSVNAPNTFGFKNRIINGNMAIDQRNAGASVTLDDTTKYTLDRWYATEDTDGGMTAQQVTTAPAGFNYSAKLTTTTADASLAAGQFCRFVQAIEGYNMADWGWGTADAKTVALSFWVRSSLTGTFGGAFRNSAGNRSYPFTYTISVADTWEQKSVTVAGDTTGTWLTTNGAGVFVQFGLGVGSTYSGTAGAWASSYLLSATGAVSVIGTLSATWYVTGVQVEVGTQATSFDFRSIGTELSLCQRYYEALYINTSASELVSASWSPNSNQSANWSFTTTKRANPTLTLGASSSWVNATPSSSVSITKAYFQTSGTYSYISGTSGNIAITASSEL